MDNETKIMLSEPELKIVQDSGLILTKHRIVQCVYELFNLQVSNIKKKLQEIEMQGFPEIVTSVPKISKGENYLRFPFVTLDYPSVFGKDIFAMRTMFWWGNFFSITLHLSGIYKEHFTERVLNNLRKNNNEIFICVSEDQWQHHFEPSNYIPAGSLSQEGLVEILNNHSFVKAAMKYRLEQWNEMNHLLPVAYNKILGLING